MSIWKRPRHHRERPTFRDEMTGRARELGASRKKSSEIERGESMSEGQDRVGARPGENEESREYRKNAEAKFASPETNTGIGYYNEDGNRLSPEEFRALVARDAARLRNENEEGE